MVRNTILTIYFKVLFQSFQGEAEVILGFDHSLKADVGMVPGSNSQPVHPDSSLIAVNYCVWTPRIICSWNRIASRLNHLAQVNIL
jgi:hypothetical protein